MKKLLAIWSDMVFITALAVIICAFWVWPIKSALNGDFYLVLTIWPASFIFCLWMVKNAGKSDL